jgi:hypothetical protein
MSDGSGDWWLGADKLWRKGRPPSGWHQTRDGLWHPPPTAATRLNPATVDSTVIKLGPRSSAPTRQAERSPAPADVTAHGGAGNAASATARPGGMPAGPPLPPPVAPSSSVFDSPREGGPAPVGLANGDPAGSGPAAASVFPGPYGDPTRDATNHGGMTQGVNGGPPNGTTGDGRPAGRGASGDPSPNGTTGDGRGPADDQTSVVGPDEASPSTPADHELPTAREAPYHANGRRTDSTYGAYKQTDEEGGRLRRDRAAPTAALAARTRPSMASARGGDTGTPEPGEADDQDQPDDDAAGGQAAEGSDARHMADGSPPVLWDVMVDRIMAWPAWLRMALPLAVVVLLLVGVTVATAGAGGNADREDSDRESPGGSSAPSTSASSSSSHASSVPSSSAPSTGPTSSTSSTTVPPPTASSAPPATSAPPSTTTTTQSPPPPPPTAPPPPPPTSPPPTPPPCPLWPLCPP